MSSAVSFEKLREHVGHEISCIYYPKDEEGDDGATDECVALECEECGQILVEGDGPIENQTQDIWLLTIYTDYGMRVYPCASHAAAKRKLFQHIVENWTREYPPPTDVDEAIEDFFVDDDSDLHLDSYVLRKEQLVK